MTIVFLKIWPAFDWKTVFSHTNVFWYDVFSEKFNKFGMEAEREEHTSEYHNFPFHSCLCLSASFILNQISAGERKLDVRVWPGPAWSLTDIPHFVLNAHVWNTFHLLIFFPFLCCPIEDISSAFLFIHIFNVSLLCKNATFDWFDGDISIFLTVVPYYQFCWKFTTATVFSERGFLAHSQS